MKTTILLILLAIASFCSGQFRHLQKTVKAESGMFQTRTGLTTSPFVDAIRPDISLGYAYTKEGGYSVAGIGMGWQHLAYDDKNERYAMQYGISLMLYVTGTLNDSPQNAGGVGIKFNLMDYLSIAAMYTFKTKGFLPVIGGTLIIK